MWAVIFWILIFCVTNSFSIALTGDRSLISGNLLSTSAAWRLITDWRFIAAMFFAVLSRFGFIMINNSLLRIPRLAAASTSITTFATLISLIFVVIANYYYLDEKLSVQQMAGAAVILVGVILMTK